jgi:thiol-disulfide isomerase/thioredoxin
MKAINSAIVLGIISACALSACGSSDAEIDPLYLNRSGSPLSSMEIQAESDAMAKGYSAALTVVGVFADGSNQVITDRVQWTSTDPAVLQVAAGASASVQAMSEGGATLTATLLEFVAYKQIVVGPAVCESIVITPDSVELKSGETLQLSAQGKFGDGSERDITTEVTWAGQDASLIDIDALGAVSAKELGETTISAKLGSAEATVATTVICGYPGKSTAIANGALFPGLSWMGAYTANGEVQRFDLEEFHCSDTYKDYSTINFIVGTEWCPNCPEYMQRLEGLAADLEANGGLLVFVEIQDQQRRPTNSSEANRIVNKYIQSDVGWRMGDTDSSPITQAFGRAISSIPDAFVVRKSDMKVIARQKESRTYLDFVDMAASPENYGD